MNFELNWEEVVHVVRTVFINTQIWTSYNGTNTIACVKYAPTTIKIKGNRNSGWHGFNPSVHFICGK